LRYHAVTVATDELLCLKNAGTQISMFFTSIEKIKILVTVLELQARQHCQSSAFTTKMGQIG
jgi:hypothetical protein